MRLDRAGLDRVAAQAVPAIEQVDLDGWLLRASGAAPWARTQSVWTAQAGGSISLPDRLAAVRRFYDERGLAPTAMVTAFSQPPGLLHALVADGWSCWKSAQVLARVASTPPEGSRWRRHPTEVVDDADWVAASASLHGWDEATTAANVDLLARTPGVGIAVVVRSDGQVTALGRGVVTDGWLGIFGMITGASHRGCGLAASVLAELLRQGADLGTTGAYLQVERDNAPALALYDAAGFAWGYDYDYWVADRPDPAATC